MPKKQEVKKTKKSAASPLKKAASNRFEGNVVSFAGHKLVMTSNEGKKYSHTLAKDAKLTCAGSVCQPDELKVGRKIRVTTNKNNRNVATSVETLN